MAEPLDMVVYTGSRASFGSDFARVPRANVVRVLRLGGVEMAVKLSIEERGLVTPYVEEFEAYARRHRVSVVEAMHAVAAESPALVEQHERFSHSIMDGYDERWLDGADEIRALRRARAQAEHMAAEKFRAEAAASRPAAGSFESFIADVLRREFGGDMSLYSEAMERAGELYPDARDAYVCGNRAGAPAPAATPAESFAGLESTLDAAIAGARESLSEARAALKQSRAARDSEPVQGGGLVYAVQEKAWREHFDATVTPAQSPDDEPQLIQMARRLLNSKFGGNPARWGEALGLAARQRPDVARAFCGLVE